MRNMEPGMYGCPLNVEIECALSLEFGLKMNLWTQPCPHFTINKYCTLVQYCLLYKPTCRWISYIVYTQSRQNETDHVFPNP